MAATEQAIEQEMETQAKPSGLQRLINRAGHRVHLKDAEGEETGVIINLKPLDGQTKLQWDNKISAAGQLRGGKVQKETLRAFLWLWEKQVINIEGVTSADTDGQEPKQWFAANPDGQVLVKIAINDYFLHQVAEASEGKA